LKFSRNKSAASAISLFLLIAMAFSLIALPSANAHDPPWTIISYAYLVPSPNPVGVGQPVAVVMWIDTPLPEAAVVNDIRRHNYTLTITGPDGDVVDMQHWDEVKDTTSVQSYQFTPTEAGNYTLKFEYGEQLYTWDEPIAGFGPPRPNEWTNDTFTGASKTAILTVQEEPLEAAKASYPLPTEYWTRPIEGQNTAWYAISSNWLGTPYIIGGGAPFGMPGGVQPDGIAPNSPHIMWTKPIQYGGVVGGDNVGVQGNTFYTGGSYNVRYSNPLIMYGTLYYQEPYGNSGGGGDYVAVDLRTGEELWRIDPTGGVPTFGYLYDYESENQHGILPNGLLVTVSGYGTQTWRAYDPRTGVLTSMEVDNVPAGLGVAGPKGEYLKYVLTNLGTTEDPDWHLMQWNSSKAIAIYGGFGPANWYSGTVDAGAPSCFDWNVSVNLGPGSWNVGADFLATFPLASLDNMILLTQGSFGGHPGDFGAVIPSEGANITAVNLNTTKGSRGNILWTKYYPPAPGNNTRGIQGWDPDAGVFIFWDKEDMVLSGYSLVNGSELWKTEPANDWMYLPNSVLVAYGKAYWTGYGGITYCYDVKDGNLLWTYGNGGPGNSTSSGLETPWGRYPTFIDVIADGKIYLGTTEHSPNTPLYKDSLFRCINATDGTEIWTIMGYATNMYGGTDVIADGYFAFLNCYDMQIYCVGKGPSAITTTASPKVSTEGDSVLVEGMVTDIAAGTEQNEQAARFPNGVPAVSDESMNAWMEYVYMQKPRPTDAVGVNVTISVLDPNGNSYEVGTTTSDANGMYSVSFTPLVSGKYTVIATFAGSESYWGSQAETAINVEQTPAATAAPTPTPAPMTDTYIVGFGSAMLVAIIVGFVLLLLRKR
jgi:hypothetical protein